MSLDFSKINKKIQDERDREKALSTGFGPKVLWWKPRAGENAIRVTPPWTEEGANAGMPFREVYRHWGVAEGGFTEEGGLSFTCPVRTPDGPGGTCEVCDFVAQLKASGNPADNEVAKNLVAKRRLYSNIVDLSDDVYTAEDMSEWEQYAREGDECHFAVGDTKVQVFSYGTTIYKLLLDFLQDGIDLGDFNEPVELKLVRDGKGLSTNYRLRLNPRSEPYEFVGDLEALNYNLDEITPFPKDGDMRNALSGNTVKKSDALSSGAKSKAPGLPAPSEDTPEALPPAAAKKMAPPPAAVEEEEAPECFNDAKTQDDDDPICVGGAGEDGEYEACAFVAECRATRLATLAKKKPAPRRSAKKAAPTAAAAPAPGSVAAVEAEMKAALGG